MYSTCSKSLSHPQLLSVFTCLLACLAGGVVSCSAHQIVPFPRVFSSYWRKRSPSDAVSRTRGWWRWDHLCFPLPLLHLPLSVYATSCLPLSHLLFPCLPLSLTHTSFSLSLSVESDAWCHPDIHKCHPEALQTCSRYYQPVTWLVSSMATLYIRY